ncbi:glycosyltransferase family 4 protein [Candidatus Entotheonella palauensis]|uniref:glycosyltransferase family 4 protein n=1 Tax=Candidatus Entotheonella palauensis TaxID=93172 RepID=UPI0015C4582F|nr:glycosyltransferase family 4 protein [Candidatus Entotheonella palauensis]
MPDTAMRPNLTGHNNVFAFIRKGPVPICNEHVSTHLHGHFPGYRMEIIDLTSWLRSRPAMLAFALIATLRAHGTAILKQRKPIKECLWRTIYLNQKVKQFMANKARQTPYAFTFQMQSLFDASVPGIPHFLYTDHTNLANRHYPHVDDNVFYPQHSRLVEQAVYDHASGIFTRSRHVTQSVIEDYHTDPAKVHCVYAGSNVPLDDIAPLDHANYTNKHILFVGIDWNRKGGPELAAAFEKILVVHPDAQLTIVGASPELNLPNCHVAGRVSAQDLNAYYWRASIFCLPTKREPFGIVFIEALAHQLPIVGTDIGAIPDFVEHGANGYLVPPFDIPALTEALLTLLGNPDQCQRFGAYGNTRILTRYNWECVAAAMASHMQHVLEAHTVLY